jgi:FkbH-like protein
MVAVPEVPDDPALFAYSLSDAGYFESLAVTAEDRERSAQYQGNIQREALRESATDMNSYLRGLDMKLIWRRFDSVGLQRIVQLINKTNQFNLTTRRYTEEDVKAIMSDRNAIGLQLRLMDRFGDNGIIAIVIGKMQVATDLLVIDTWLMSCRVLGRQVERTTLNLLARRAREMGAQSLIGDYVPTKKNGMVKNHYTLLGFSTPDEKPDGSSRSILDIREYARARNLY